MSDERQLALDAAEEKRRAFEHAIMDALGVTRCPMVSFAAYVHHDYCDAIANLLNSRPCPGGGPRTSKIPSAREAGHWILDTVGQPCPGGDLFPHRPTCDGIASALCERDDTARADLERAVALLRRDHALHTSRGRVATQEWLDVTDDVDAFLRDLDTRSGT